MPSDSSERTFDKAFMAYQRGELLEALMLYEQSFLLDPTHEVALLNYMRTLRLLTSGELVPERVLRLVSKANTTATNDAVTGAPSTSREVADARKLESSAIGL